MNKTRAIKIGLIVISITGLVVISLLVAYLYSSPGQAEQTIPQVEITGVSPGERVPVNQPVIVLARAEDPDGIEEAELMVNGEVVASQANPEAPAGSEFFIRQVWHPTGAGMFSVMVRARDQEGQVGQADVTLVEAYSGQETADGDGNSQYFMGEGESLGDVAEDLGTTTDALRDLNPDLEGQDPAAGQDITVPPPAGESADQGQPAGGGSPGVAPGGQGGGQGGGQPAQNARPPWWSDIITGPSGLGNIVDPHQVCDAAPLLCQLRRGSREPVIGPSDVSAEDGGDCRVKLSWTDRADNESGYTIKRFRTDSTDGKIVASLQPNPGQGERWTYTDVVPAVGEYFYLVSADNDRYSSPGPPAGPLPVDCTDPGGEKVAVELEALNMQVASDEPQLHCYLKVDGLPRTRVPESPGLFLEVSGGSANIEEYLGEDRSLRLLVDPGGPLDVDVKCVALDRPPVVNGKLQGNSSLRTLGKAVKSHPPAEWDGRDLEARPLSGEFSLTYRILSGDQARPVAARQAPRPGIADAELEAPVIGGFKDEWRECAARGAKVPDCETHQEDGLWWNWEPPEGVGDEVLHSFRVYAREDGGDQAALLYESDPVPLSHLGWTQSGPLIDQETLCAVYAGYREPARADIEYYVHAMLYSPSEKRWVASPPSQHLQRTEHCEKVVVLKVTLQQLAFSDIDHIGDSPNKFLGYGWLDIDPYQIHWNAFNFEYEEYENVPSGTLINGDTSLSMDDLWLRIFREDGRSSQVGPWRPPTGFEKNNHVFYIPITIQQSISIEVRLYAVEKNVFPLTLGHPPESACEALHILRSRSPEEWLTYDEQITITRDNAAATCRLDFTVQGMTMDEAQP